MSRPPQKMLNLRMLPNLPVQHTLECSIVANGAHATSKWLFPRARASFFLPAHFFCNSREDSVSVLQTSSLVRRLKSHDTRSTAPVGPTGHGESGVHLRTCVHLQKPRIVRLYFFAAYAQHVLRWESKRDELPRPFSRRKILILTDIQHIAVRQMGSYLRSVLIEEA